MSELAYCTRFAGKYFGDHPDRSIQVFGLCVAMASASSCQGKEGCAITIVKDGMSAATSSRNIGFEYLSLTAMQPGSPAPTPVCPVWNSAGRPAPAISSYNA